MTTGDRGIRTTDQATMEESPSSDQGPGTKDETTAVRSSAPYRLYNIGNHTPVDLLRFIEVIEQALGKTAAKKLLPMQPGDVPATFADVGALIRDVGFAPSTPIEVGVERFVAWFRDYYGAAGPGRGQG